MLFRSGEVTVSVVEVIEEDGVAVLEIVTVTGSDLTTEGGAGSDFGASRETPGRDIPGRSEERRVGKECRSRGSPYH